MKLFSAFAVSAALLASPTLAANYLIHDHDGHGVTECTWDEAEVVTDWPGLVIPADATEVRMCVTDRAPFAVRAAAVFAAQAQTGTSPVAPKPKPVDPTPTEPTPTDPEPTDPDPIDP